MPAITVLFIPAGSGIAISGIKSIKNIEDIKTVAADSDPLAAGLYLAEKKYLIPEFNNPKFFSIIQKIILKEKIDILIPCLDPLLEIIANYGPTKLEKRLGVKILISPPETIKLTRDKWLAYNRFKNILNFPESWIDLDDVPKDTFPLFIKPRKGSGSIGATIVRNQTELEFFFSYLDDPIISEYLEGKEYTVDCLASPKGKLITIIPRERIQSKAGISIKAKFMNVTDEIIEIAKEVNKQLHFIGPFFFQLKQGSDNTLKIMEFNARLSGTMIFSNLAGFNIVEKAIRQFNDRDNLISNRTQSNPLLLPGKDFFYEYEAMSRYWEEILIKTHDLKSLQIEE